MRARFLFTLLVLLAAAVSAAGSRQLSRFGVWKPIPHLKDPHVKEIASFAVTEYYKSKKASLKLTGIERGEMQIVDGIKYRLIISAVDGTGAVTHDYQAVVWDKLRTHERRLLSFYRRPYN